LHSPIADLIRYDDFHLSLSDSDSNQPEAPRSAILLRREKSSKVASPAFSVKSLSQKEKKTGA